MKTNNVVYMETVRDLLAELDALRADVIKGGVVGWGGMVKHCNGSEVVYLGGTFKHNSDERTRCVLKVSAVAALHDPYLPPPPAREPHRRGSGVIVRIDR